ncbi:hypothetical protein [Agriterribacter sp.]|uniref:hypothetical protein n=1 Tax=Agriterribacter sp. TaxID=2821509 RepID=UPI002C392A05|nr:hypothetical protein [Agriterribacter sp.]HTN09254.1 hypothetical protein [Agriterribacter sp.]
MKHKIVKIGALVSAFFGLLTVFAGGSVILDLFGMREKEGNYILFVVWANFICGFLYLIASYGFFKRKNWTASIIGFTVWILIAAFIVLFFRIWDEEPYENKTIIAMVFRTLLTLGLLWIARTFKNRVSIDMIL